MIPWRRKWQLTLVFVPGKSHGLGAWWAIYSPWGHGRVRQDLATEQQQNTPCTVCEILARQLSYKVIGRKNGALMWINHQNIKKKKTGMGERRPSLFLFQQ